MNSLFPLLAAAGASAAGPTSIYGIEVNAPLAIEMCEVVPLGEGELAKYNSSKRPEAGACWGHKKIDDIGKPLRDGRIDIYFNWNEYMPPMFNNRLDGQILNGKLVYVAADTSGLKTQLQDFAVLTEKFGKPTSMGTRMLQNGFGAKFEAAEAAWKLPNGLVAKFVGWSDEEGLGRFSIGTSEGERAYLTLNDAPKPTIPL